MANKIIKTGIRPETFLVDKLSRYVDSAVVYYGDNNILTFTTYKREDAPADILNDQFTVITSGTEYRPDKLSNQAYGTPDLWWKIMQANGIFDIWEFKAGLNIRLPANANIF